jgi:hypothetical protein
MSPRIGDEKDHVEWKPEGKDHTRIRIRISYATIIVVLFLLFACIMFVALTLGGKI